MLLLRFHKWFILLFSSLVLLIQASRAQYTEKDFVRYTVKNGLSDNYITCLQQDDRGYIWVGTDGGLNRFDGYSFNNFYPGSSNLQLPSNTISNLKIFGAHQLGIISSGGFQLLNTDNFSSCNYFVPDSTAFNTYRNRAWDAQQLPDHSFAVTTNSGFYTFDATGKLDTRFDAYKLEDIGNKKIRYGRDIFSLNDTDHLVYVEERGLAYYNSVSKSFNRVTVAEKKWSSFYHPSASDGNGWMCKFQLNRNEFIFIYTGKDSIVYYNHRLKKEVISALPVHPLSEFNWESKLLVLTDSSFAINSGTNGFYLFLINHTTGTITCNPNKFLSSYKVNCLLLDKENRLWAGTNRGMLQEIQNKPFLSTWSFAPPGGNNAVEFKAVYRYKNKLYLGRASRHKGLLIVDTASMKAEKEILFFGNDNMWNEIGYIEMYHPDTLWLGTNGGILWFDTKTERYGKVIDELNYPSLGSFTPVLAPAHPDGNVWICDLLNGRVARYHISSRTFTFFTSQTKPALPFDKVKNIAYDSYGDVWIGGHALARWNNHTQRFDTLIKVYGGPNKFNDDILTLSADDNGSLWLHNAYNGLLEYRIADKKFIAYSQQDGLPASEIRSLSPVVNNILWIGCDNAMARFDIRTKKAIVFDQHDGLPEDRPSSRKIYFDPAGRYLYAVCNTMLVKFPLDPPGLKGNASGLIVQELVVNNQHSFFHPANGLRLRPGENNLTLRFTVIDFEQGGNYQFAYKLNETEIWTDIGSQRSINLTGLPSDSYSIQLRATGKSGEQKINEFNFRIAPPFWKTTWFIVGCSLLVAGTLYYLYRRRINQIRARANIDKQLSLAEIKALHAQMNPHFIFNSLNSIREMILSKEDKEASHFLGKFAHLIRMTLDQSGQPYISLRNTMDYLTRYIEMEQIRNADFTFRILADDELDPDETILPPMLIQPFIENAIWHGTTGDRKNININIDFKKSTGSNGQNSQLVCIIDDNGIGIDQSLKNKKESGSNHRPVGISNIKNRIRLLNEKHNLQSSVTIQDKNGLEGYTETGTLVILRLPLETTDNE